MSDKTKINLLLTLLVGTSIFSAYALMSKGKSSPAIAIVFDQKKKPKQVNFATFDKNDFWDNYPFLVLTNNNRFIDPATKFFAKDGTVIRLATLTTNGPKLFLRISRKNYQEQYVKDLLTYLKINNIPVALILDADAPKFLTLFLKENQIDQEAYMLIKSLDDLTIEGLKLPYLFVLSPKLQVSKLYIPRAEAPEMTQQYISTVIDRQVKPLKR